MALSATAHTRAAACALLIVMALHGHNSIVLPHPAAFVALDTLDASQTLTLL